VSKSFFDFGGDFGTTDLSAADDKTLRLAMAPLSEEELGGLKRFMQTWLTHAEPASGQEALAKAHQEGLQATGGMKPGRVEQGLALLRLFCGKRWTAQRLRTKLQQLESAGPEKDALREKIHEELDRLERETEELGRRFGPETVLLLRRHEPELLALHTRMTQVLSRG
jgi:hypothetical protein